MKKSKIAIEQSKFELISSFELISEESDGRLFGGFSGTFSIESLTNSLALGSNNCNGGNCVAGCGKGQNTGCNTTYGCS